MTQNLLSKLASLNEDELRRELTEILTRQKLGLVWEHSAIERDRAANQDIVLPRLDARLSQGLDEGPCQNLIIEGDNFDSLRLLRATHTNKIRVIYIDPPYNTGNKDWVYNDDFVGKNDRWRHSQWLEFLFQRLVLARDLLAPDGVIMVSINDENRSRLELLMDEVFPGMRLGSLAWRTKDTGNDLTQRFSHVHEHVLIYAKKGFAFNGKPTNRSKFRNPDKDARGDWSPQPLTKAHSSTDRKNTYYPIQDPETGYWYPCDPNRVWAYASETVIRQLCNNDEEAVQEALNGLRSDTIEALIRKKLVYFPPAKPKDVLIYKTRADLVAAIKAGKGPALPKKKTPLLREDLPDLDFWVGKPIAPGRPSRKEHWTARPESERLAPLSSWIAGMKDKVEEEADDMEVLVLKSAKGGVGTDEVKNILGSKVFQHPKPLSLIKGLLSQAMRPDDIVLDFFGGSGTTAHAALELNHEDGGSRKFILCSNTEETGKSGKNLCRDVCAERVRRAATGYGKTKGLGGRFAYLTLDRFDPADVELDASTSNIRQLLSLRLHGAALPERDDQVLIDVIASTPEVAAVYAHKITQAAIDEMVLLRQPRLLVFSDRPDTARELLVAAGKSCESRPIGMEIAAGQAGAAPTQFAPQEAQ